MPGPSAFACASNFIGREIPPRPVGNVADKCSPAMWSIPRRLPHFELPLFWADTLSRSNTSKNLNERWYLVDSPQSLGSLRFNVGCRGKPFRSVPKAATRPLPRQSLGVCVARVRYETRAAHGTH